MKILVLMKQVANKDAILRINKDSTWIDEADLSFEVNESDGYALEEALRIKEKVGGEVVVVSMGPQRAKSVIKDALARGAEVGSAVVEPGRSGDGGLCGAAGASFPASQHPQTVVAGRHRAATLACFRVSQLAGRGADRHHRAQSAVPRADLVS